ncbi:MAG: ABC transporter ATP-binding protein [Rhizobiales bacterium]|nr:ABC transporter ATP-binding protein [Hyphomicrobiales bacterium]
MSDRDDLDVVDLSKRYGPVVALDKVGFKLAAGEFLTLLGPSGSGKTTTLMTIAGFVRADAGAIRIGGADIAGLPPERRGFGVVFQGYALFPHMSVAENVAFPLEARGVGRAERDEQVKAALDRVQLLPYADRKPRALSGGQQQRVALARALVYGPKVLLLDEPLSALDRKLRSELQWELRRLHRDLGVSFLYVTHDQEEALTMSDSIAIFERGRIVQHGTPEALFESPVSHFVADFFGRSNFFPGMAGATEGGVAKVTWEGGEDGVRATAAITSGQAVHVAIRPHHIRLADPGSAKLSGSVIERSYVGNLLHCLVRTPRGTVVMVELPAVSGFGGAPDVGAAVGLAFDAQAAVAVPRDGRAGNAGGAKARDLLALAGQHP